MTWIKSPHPWLDVTHAPIYIAQIPAGITDDELKKYFQDTEAFLLERPHRYVYVTDTSFIQSSTASQRRIVADADIRLREHDTKWCAGMAIVAKTALMRGATTAVYWLSPPVYAYKIVSSLSEAILWGRSQLEK